MTRCGQGGGGGIAGSGGQGGREGGVWRRFRGRRGIGWSGEEEAVMTFWFWFGVYPSKGPFEGDGVRRDDMMGVVGRIEGPVSIIWCWPDETNIARRAGLRATGTCAAAFRPAARRLAQAREDAQPAHASSIAPALHTHSYACRPTATAPLPRPRATTSLSTLPHVGNPRVLVHPPAREHRLSPSRMQPRLRAPGFGVNGVNTPHPPPPTRPSHGAAKGTVLWQRYMHKR